MNYKYPVYQPSLTGNEKKYVNECLDSTWISSKGKFVKQFEEQFAGYVGTRHAASVCNGTVAIHLALVALGIGRGDEVIVPTLTYVASVNAIAYTGATPVFADSVKATWQLDPAEVRSRITPRTRAVLVVHLYGHPCEMDEIVALCEEHNLFLVEDCAEAIGTRYKGRHVGSFGHISTFSFFGNKTITTGEGGMVVTNDDTLHDRSVHFKGQGLAKYREYWHDVVGYNYRMTNVCAAIGLAQLERVDDLLTRKRAVADGYRARLEGSGFEFHGEAAGCLHSYWMCSVLTQNSAERDAVRARLSDAGIETRPLFYPVHTMPMYSRRYERFQVAENLGWRGINLPSYPDLKEQDVAYIADALLAAALHPA